MSRAPLALSKDTSPLSDTTREPKAAEKPDGFTVDAAASASGSTAPGAPADDEEGSTAGEAKGAQKDDKGTKDKGTKADGAEKKGPQDAD